MTTSCPTTSYCSPFRQSCRFRHNVCCNSDSRLSYVCWFVLRSIPPATIWQTSTSNFGVCLCKCHWDLFFLPRVAWQHRNELKRDGEKKTSKIVHRCFFFFFFLSITTSSRFSNLSNMLIFFFSPVLVASYAFILTRFWGGQYLFCTLSCGYLKSCHRFRLWSGT